MTSECPHDQSFWQRWWMGVWLKMTQMLLLYISAHLYVVFLKNERVFVPRFSCTCVSGGTVCIPVYLIVWVLYFLMYLYPSRPIERLLAVCVCVCWLYSQHIDKIFFSGFLTHVPMAIKEFSLFGIHFFPWTVCSYIVDLHRPEWEISNWGVWWYVEQHNN